MVSRARASFVVVLVACSAACARRGGEAPPVTELAIERRPVVASPATATPPPECPYGSSWSVAKGLCTFSDLGGLTPWQPPAEDAHRPNLDPCRLFDAEHPEFNCDPLK
jgi:hypothetical protein